MQLFKSYYLFFLFLNLFVAFGQENNLYKWHTSDNDELPQSSVKAIVPDKYGFIWLSTENGIVRYDGNTFLPFNSSTIKLNGNRFNQIFGNIKSDSLYAYNNDQKELLLINKRTAKIAKNKKNYSIFRNGNEFFSCELLPTLIHLENNSIFFYINLHNNNKYFIGNNEVELCDAKMKSIYKKKYKYKSGITFFTINDNLYFLNKNGEYTCYSKGNTKSEKLSSIFGDDIKLYWNNAAKQIFVSSGNKIFLLDSQKNHLTVKFITEFKDFDTSNIVSIFLDHENQKLYLGSSTNGLCVVSFPKFNIVKKNSLNDDLYYSSTSFDDNSIITPDGLIIDSEKVINNLPFIDFNSFNGKITITKDDNDDIWIVRQNKLFCYLKAANYKKKIQYHFNQSIKTIYKDSNNTIWVSLEKNFLNSAKLYFISNLRSKEIKFVLAAKSNINYIKQLGKNKLYLGTEKGLYRYDFLNKKLWFINSTENINVRSIFIDNDNKIWFTTYEKGFFLYNNSRIYSFPKDSNNYLFSSHCIIEDNKGFFWITTNKGLFQVSEKSLLDYTIDKKHKIFYYYYNKEDGFVTNEFNGGCQPCGNYLKNGQISFPSMNGMVFYDPNSTKPILPNKEPFINKAVIDHKMTFFNDTIKLNNDFERVEFIIDYAYFGNMANLNLEAKLKGSNSNWEKIGLNKSVSFTSMQPGKYNLVIRVLSDFNSNYKYKTITIIVPALFYQTIWFRVFSAILIMILIIFGLWLRYKYIERKSKKLEHIISERTQKLSETIAKLKKVENNLKQEILQQKKLIQAISHDIRSPLKYIVLIGKYLYNETKKGTNTASQKYAKSIFKTSSQLYAFTELLLEYSNIYIEEKNFEQEDYSFYELVENKKLLFEGIANNKNIKIINNIDSAIYTKINFRIMSNIIHNLLDNSLKHSDNGEINLSAKIKENKLTFWIKDTGVGMSQELINYYTHLHKNPESERLVLRNYGVGLHLVLELLVIIKGEITFLSADNEGTQITIEIDY